MKKDSLAVLVEAVKRFGPRNYSLLSRVTGIPTETVRYKIDHQLVRTGVRVHVSVDYHKLAMVRTWGTFYFEEDNDIISKGVLEALAKIGYLTYHGQVLPHGKFVVAHCIPARFYDDYRKFLEGLVDVGILKSFAMNRLDFLRHLSMKPEFFDFKRRKWKIPWDRLDPGEARVPHIISEPRTEPLADKVDLFILKELQLDCTRSLAAIARKLGMNYKTLRYHYLEHVAQRNLIDKYVVRWQGTVTK
ncbi:MAG: AsnC family protein, partial [Candidatus Geothermarchaeales archaeon]